MSDPEEDRISPPAIFPKSTKNLDAASLMDFDIDVPWPLDQIHFLSNPTSPLLFSSADDPCSPLWAFSDVSNHDNKLAGVVQALPDPARYVSATNQVVEKPRENEDNKILASPFSGLQPSPDGYFMIKERITQALRYLKESSDQHVLAQVWAPVKVGNRYVLTTSGQPFVLDPHDGLHQYRMVSLMYMFSVDGDNDGVLGLPGRVFQQKLPEWTPNVQYYSIKEYPRLDHAQHYNVQGTLALPVFEPSGRSCIGVIELIMTSQKINYAPEVDKICKALEAVSLKSSQMLDHTSTQIQIRNEGRQSALTEILEILTMVCETHKLPLGQTWVPCMHRNVLAYGGGMKKSCTSFDGSCMEQVCMSTTDVAVYIVDAHMWGFREACVEHHLQKGQGVAGRAYLSRNACFCRDISQFRKTEYPLVHYARMFGLTSSFAICLQSTHTGNDDYILEFFLPPSITDSCEQQALLGSILAIVKAHCQNLKVASGIGLAEEGIVEIVQASINEGLDSRLECIHIPCYVDPLPGSSLPISKEKVHLDPAKPQLMVDIDAINEERNAVLKGGNNSISHLENKDIKKTSERKRGKTEKSISLEVLQQYFAGSLKDAAKSLGVCPTTMKRICRQHGISRWPSRKINKVNRSLSKLKLVIESVQGGEGAFGLSPLTGPLTGPVGSISQPYEVQGEKKDSPSSSSPGKEGQCGREDPLQDIGKGSNSSKTGSGSREASTGTPTSHGSCQGSPANVSAMAKEPFVSSTHEQFAEVDRSPESAFRPPEELYVPGPCSIPDALRITVPDEPSRGILLEDAGSSKDLRNLCPFADITVDEQVPEVFWTDPPCPNTAPKQSMPTITYTMPQNTSLQEMRSVTIKAAYKDDIIRFRIAMSSCIVDLKEEVAKRLKLEVGTFDMKYMDDDLEWVLIACDADLQECMEICRSSGSNMIRLSVHDILPNLGSSCESTEE
ncbi:protein NLP6-like [Argentina anserina]|uniref:protein NLP6-like n=1 Tax=Argentina anserina TaxID=57926 RepID=UPI00217688AB|nr:protein NLP6-like [Potentilla anserina]